MAWQDKTDTLRSYVESQKAFVQSADYRSIREWNQARMNQEEWRQKILHLIEGEPVRLTQMEEENKGLHMTLAGPLPNVLACIDKCHEELPYVHMDADKLWYDAGTTQVRVTING